MIALVATIVYVVLRSFVCLKLYNETKPRNLVEILASES